jgi:hypothetical protein
MKWKEMYSENPIRVTLEAGERGREENVGEDREELQGLKDKD